MQKILIKCINLEKDKSDYCNGLASIYSTTTAKVLRTAVDLCFRNNDVFVEFLKKTLENERLENAKRREEKNARRSSKEQC